MFEMYLVLIIEANPMFLKSFFLLLVGLLQDFCFDCCPIDIPYLLGSCLQLLVVFFLANAVEILLSEGHN